MNVKNRNVLIVAAMAIALAQPVLAGQSTSQEVTDARQETQIWTTYALSPYLRANDLKVVVHSGKATLSGKVEEGVSKDLAKQIAMGVNGIKEVDNQIVVQSDYVPAKSAASRSFGETIDDATITAAVKSKLLWSKNVSGITTDVNTKAGRVSLSGTADTMAAKELASHLALNTRGVVGVDNNLVVKAAKPAEGTTLKSETTAVEHDIADSWITTKVKSTYLYSSNVNGSDIGVTTVGGIVTLSGKVDSGAERALAIEFAQNVRGVKKVEAMSLTL